MQGKSRSCPLQKGGRIPAQAFPTLLTGHGYGLGTQGRRNCCTHQESQGLNREYLWTVAHEPVCEKQGRSIEPGCQGTPSPPLRLSMGGLRPSNLKCLALSWTIPPSCSWARRPGTHNLQAPGGPGNSCQVHPEPAFPSSRNLLPNLLHSISHCAAVNDFS